jgi:hypothetical protein
MKPEVPQEGGMNAHGEGPRLRGSTRGSAAGDRHPGPNLKLDVPEVAA